MIDDTLFDAALSAIDSIPRGRRKDMDMLAEAVRRAVRSTADNLWGKKADRDSLPQQDLIATLNFRRIACTGRLW